MHTHIHRLCDIEFSVSLVAHHNYDYIIGEVFAYMFVGCSTHLVLYLFAYLSLLIIVVYFKNMLKKCNIIIIIRME